MMSLDEKFAQMQFEDMTRLVAWDKFKAKLMDKIDCEIEVAKRWRIDEKYFRGKIHALQDLKQWIEDLE